LAALNISFIVGEFRISELLEGFIRVEDGKKSNLNLESVDDQIGKVRFVGNHVDQAWRIYVAKGPGHRRVSQVGVNQQSACAALRHEGRETCRDRRFSFAGEGRNDPITLPPVG